MKTMTAVDAKNHFGKFLDIAQREPVLVTKNERPVGVFLSIADFGDMIWGQKALNAHKDEYVSADDAHKLIERLLGTKP